MQVRHSRWTAEDARAWFAARPRPLGCNFLPSTAVNQLEMFQPDDYDRHRPVLVRELDWAAGAGLNSLRVFLHDLLWETDADGFFKRLDDFLDLCAARNIQPMLVFFDACHRPEPQPGPQPPPTPGLHNPGWAQSPAVSTLTNPTQWGRLERYVTDVLRRHGTDPRILCWDLYNEPCNGGFDGNSTKATASARLVTEVFAWARAAGAAQPLTVCAWNAPRPLAPVNEDMLDAHGRALLAAQRTAVEHSDVLSFHDYGGPDSVRTWVTELSTLGRPVLCTEYMARTTGSRFDNILPILNELNVGAYHWGWVAGKSQTWFPWGPAGDPAEPALWFHDVLRPDGSPFNAAEIELLRASAQLRRTA